VERSFARPFLKWAGGKTQLLPAFEKLYPRRGVRRYLEPFLGSGAVFFHAQALLQPQQSILTDNNEDLIATFTAVKDGVDDVITALDRHKRRHSEEYFYAMRQKKPRGLVERAARLIYLNKTCFNGLYRVNSRGQFNVPFGRYKKDPGIFDAEALRRASSQLRQAEIRAAHFAEVVDLAQAGDFVYFDPPYHPVSETAYFTSYTRDRFGAEQQEQLAEVFAKLDAKGCLVMLSNSDTPLIRKLYREFDERTVQVKARRNINSKADRRGPVNEVVVLNYQPGAA
jgi:DNA adenine methylase